MEEMHNSVEPSTTRCPLLPGQQVNILKVPTQSPARGKVRSRSQELLDSNVFTLDPQARYRRLKPSAECRTLSDPLALPSLASSHSLLPALVRQEARVLAPSSSTVPVPQPEPLLRPKTSCMPFPGPSPLAALLGKMRGTRSSPATAAGETSPNTTRCQKRRAMPQTGRKEIQQTRRLESTPRAAQLPPAPASTSEWTSPALQSTGATPEARPSIQRPNADSAPVASSTNSDYASSISTGSNVRAHEYTDLVDRFGAAGIRSQALPGKPSSNILRSRAQQASCYPKEPTAPPSSPSTAPQAYFIQAAQSVQQQRNDSDAHPAGEHRAASIMLPIQANTLPAESEDRTHEITAAEARKLRATRLPSLLHDNKSTLNSFFIECPPADGPLSPYNLSQPDTPSTRDFDSTPPSEMSSSARGSSEHFPMRNHDGNFLPSPQLPSPGFSLYHLPEENQASATTLRELPLMDHLVRQWDDGVEQRRLTNADTLDTDLGYLGRVIL